jgi:hypothetical protein
VKTYADGLREAARICESEILSDDREPIIGDDRHARDARMLRDTATASMRILAHRFRRLADESTD